MWDKLFDLQNGVVGTCVLLAIMVILKVGEFVWKFLEKKDSTTAQAMKDLSESLTKATYALDQLSLRATSLEKSLAELPKIKMDLRRYYAALKFLSGEKWSDIKKQMEDELPL